MLRDLLSWSEVGRTYPCKKAGNEPRFPVCILYIYRGISMLVVDSSRVPIHAFEDLYGS